MAVLTDYELKAYNYVERRRTPPSVGEVSLHLKTSRQAAHRVLTNLARKGKLKSFMEKVPLKKPERRYITLDNPLIQKLGLDVVKPKKEPARINYFNDPFNLTRHG